MSRSGGGKKIINQGKNPKKKSEVMRQKSTKQPTKNMPADEKRDAIVKGAKQKRIHGFIEPRKKETAISKTNEAKVTVRRGAPPFSGEARSRIGTKCEGQGGKWKLWQEKTLTEEQKGANDWESSKGGTAAG